MSLTSYLRDKVAKQAAVNQITRIMAEPWAEEGACARAEREHKERRACRLEIRDTMGMDPRLKKYQHGVECMAYMTEATFKRDWDGSRAVMVRELHEDREGAEVRFLVHRCGVKNGERCGYAFAYNRIPESRNQRSTTTERVARHSKLGAAQRFRGERDSRSPENSMRDCGTSYYMPTPKGV